MEGKTREIKYQTVKITVPNGTAVGTLINDQVILDQQYKRCTGVALYVTAGPLTLSLGLTTQAGSVIQDLTHTDDYLPSTAVPLNERYKDINVAAGGNFIQYTLTPWQLLGADQSFHLVFRLER